MSGPANPLEANLIRRFLLGRLREPQHSEVEQILATTTEWLNVAEAAEGHDELLGALRGLGATEETPLPSSVAELIPRFERLMPSNSVTQSERYYAEPSAQYPFLAPPQRQGELGRLGSYRVLRQLGAGGMGIVFGGEDALLKRPVALKVMRPEIAAFPDACQRFIREAQAAAALDHPNVVQIYQVAEAPVPFIAMPLLAGESLADRLKRAPLVPLAEVLRIGKETAQGLAAAHAAGLIHRDIKPGNLLLTPACVKILDFGLARPIDGDSDLTRPNAVLGTPGYMAPEQAKGLPVTARSDLFSLGCVLYELATGTRPFVGPTVAAVHDLEPPHRVRPEVPPALSALIVQLLSQAADERPTSAQDVAQTLASLETAETVSYVAPSSIAGRRRQCRRLMMSVTAVLAAGFLAIGLFFAFRPGPERPPPGPGPLPGPLPGPQPTPAAYKGSVDILVWTKAEGLVRKLRLTDPGALPLSPGDQIRVTARIQPAAFLYLFWIDEEGKAAPVYPWNAKLGWGTRPQKESPVVAVDLPEQLTQGFTITPGREGMESLIMLALDAPLTANDEELQRLLDGLPPQHPLQNAHAAVWFENGTVVENDPLRQRSFTVSDINDPVLRLQERLGQKLQPLARYSAAVSFARQGKK